MELFELCRQFSMTAIVLRLVFAMLCGVAVGFEREIRNKRAGLKTHTLVCLGAALCVIVSECIALGREGITTDATRIAANVVTGVGFLCAATLMVRANGDVRGLTTAAGLWAVAIIGLACGAGWIEVGMLGVAAILFTFIVLQRVDGWIEKFSRGFDLYAELKEGDDSVEQLLSALHGYNVRFGDFTISPSAAGKGVSVRLSATVEHFGEKEDVIGELRALPCVRYIETF